MKAGGVEVGAVVGSGKGLHLVVPAVVKHIRRDGFAQPRPRWVDREAVSLPHVQSTVDGKPAHDLGVKVVAGNPALFPDAVIGFAPAPCPRSAHAAAYLPPGTVK